MDSEQLNEILGGNAPPEPTFLQDKADVINSTGEPETQNNGSGGLEPSEKVYKCKVCDFQTSKLTDLMRHTRYNHPKPKSPKNTENEAIDLEEKEDMSDETDIIPASIGMVTPVETEEAKPKQKKKDITAVPTLYDRLEQLLKGYQVRGVQGIIQSAQMYDVGSSSFIPVLKDLLRNTSTSPGLIGNIAAAWEQIVGIKSETDAAVPIGQVKTVSQTSDVMSMISKLREEEMADAVLENYNAKSENRKLENEMKRKRLSGELMNPNNSDVDRLRLEIEMLKLQNMSPKANGVDELKLELAKLQSQLTAPKTDPQVEILKQQLESQNKKYEDMQRKLEEDAKLTQLREDARRDREALEKRLEEQAKQTQELIKSLQTANAPKQEDMLKQQIAEMKQSFSDQLKSITESKKEDEYRHTIELLKEEIKETKEQSQGQIGQVAESMKSFATEITHAFEKKEMKEDHERKEEELKKKISDIEHNRALTNEQYFAERGMEMAKEGMKMVTNAGDALKEVIKPSVEKQSEMTSAVDRFKLASELKAQGFNPTHITEILNGRQTIRGPLQTGDARKAYENLSKITQDIKISEAQPSPAAPEIAEPPQEPTQTEVKFSSADGKE